MGQISERSCPFSFCHTRTALTFSLPSHTSSPVPLRPRTGCFIASTILHCFVPPVICAFYNSMATPTRQLIGDPLQNLGPSSSFLQQLLDEINGTRPSSAPPQRQVTSTGTSATTPSTQRSRRTSSVWMGGGPMAQDARQKLRAADEARLRKTQTGNRTAAPVKQTPKLRLQVPDFKLTTPIKGSSPISPLGTAYFDDVWGESDRTRQPPPTPRPVKSAPSKPVGDDSRLPISTIHVSQPTTAGIVLGTDSPLIFCDVDSDTTSTPSPEEPTSAISGTGTDATSVSS